MVDKNILIITGGGVDHLKPFETEAQKLGIKLKTSSFADLEYELGGGKKFNLKVGGEDISSFSLIFIRLVGKRFEELSLLVSSAKDAGVRIVDRIYNQSGFARLPLGKSLEMKLLSQASVPVPQTLFSDLKRISTKAPELFGYPFVIKGTQGKQGHAVWSPRNKKNLDKLMLLLGPKEEAGERFFAQEFVKAGQRVRVLVIGGQAVAAITRPTRWRRRFVGKVDGKFPEGERKGLIPIPQVFADMAVKAANALSIDIAGVDIVRDDKTGEAYVLEVNSAPRWASIEADTGVNVEKEILNFLLKDS